jgi:hypothetical protein
MADCFHRKRGEFKPVSKIVPADVRAAAITGIPSATRERDFWIGQSPTGLFPALTAL